MGSTASACEKKLENCQWTFKDPDISYNFSFSEKKVFIIKDKDSAEYALGMLEEQDILYVNFVGDNFGTDEAKLVLVQIAISSNCCLIFTLKCKKELEVLKEVLESNKIKKVFHDCAGGISALAVLGKYKKGGIIVHNVEDTQVCRMALLLNVAQLYVRKCRDIELIVEHLPKLSLQDLYTYCFGGDCPHVNIRPLENSDQKFSETLDEKIVKYLALNVLLLPEIFDYLMKNIHPKWNLIPYKDMVEKIRLENI